jgi:hypothetical protein
MPDRGGPLWNPTRWLRNLSEPVAPMAVEPSKLDDVPVYFLRTEPRALKYLGFYSAVVYIMTVDIRMGFFTTPTLSDFMSLRLERALHVHKSQVVWYREFWLIWSRFMFFNHLVLQRKN